MKSNSKYIWVLLIVFLLLNCEQKVTVKEAKLTGINPLSFTDVVYKSKRDTVLVSSFDGKITEVINHDNGIEKRLIISLEDEIYSLAYYPSKNLIYASTLNHGIVVINEQKAEIEKRLPIKDKWVSRIYFNPEAHILAGSDYSQNAYVWDLEDKALSIPKELGNMQPKAITDKGIIYFDGNGYIKKWDVEHNAVSEKLKLTGLIADANSEGEVLATAYDRFLLKDVDKDTLLMDKKHPNWPIYVKSRDTTVMVPVSLQLTDAILSKKNIYTSSIDRSVRKWNKESGELIEDFLGHRATISALSITSDETQLVSVDLKGGIKFWDLTK